MDHVQEYYLRNGCGITTVTSWQPTDDDTLRTLLTEVECIIDSRLLLADNLCEPLTPSHLPTMKPKRVLMPLGQFQRAYIIVSDVAEEFSIWQINLLYSFRIQ